MALVAVELAAPAPWHSCRVDCRRADVPAPAPRLLLTFGAAVAATGGRQLLLDGVVQTAVPLSPGVISFDGPFTA